MTHSQLTVHYAKPSFEGEEAFWEVVLGTMNQQYASDTKKPAVKKARELAKTTYRPAKLIIKDKKGNVIENTRYD